MCRDFSCKKQETVDNLNKTAIIDTTNNMDVAISLQYIGKIDIDIYRCITSDIDTDEVIITDERIKHIKGHHPGHYEEIEPFMGIAVSGPAYILEDAANTGLILKQVDDEKVRMHIVLKVHTSTDIKGYKNSIISAWKISESRWNSYLRNKKILYNRE